MSTVTKYYLVGDHRFALCARAEQLALLPNYTPFEMPQSGENVLFSIRVTDAPLPSSEGWTHVYTDRSDEDMPRVEMYRRDAEWLLCLSEMRESEIVCAVRCTEDFRKAEVFMRPNTLRFSVDNASMLDRKSVV